MSKAMGIFVKFGSFYHAHLPNMVVGSRDPRCNFQFFLFSANSTFDIRKSHKISCRKAFYFKSSQPKTSGGGTPPPPVPLGLSPVQFYKPETVSVRPFSSLQGFSSSGTASKSFLTLVL